MAKIKCDDCPICRQFGAWSRIHLPVAVALIQRDEVVSLLAALGATIDVPISPTGQSSMNLLQWVSAVVANLSKAISAPSQQEESSQELPTSAANTWAQYRAYLNAVLPTREDVGPQVIPSTWNAQTLPPNEEYIRWATRDYYARAESVMRSYSTVPFQTDEIPIAPTAQTFPVQQQVISQGSRYICHGKNMTTPVPAHLKVLYDELYEACWMGDSASVQELCLPKHLTEGKEPIQISAHAALSGSLIGYEGML
jgi:hypothetical protein